MDTKWWWRRFAGGEVLGQMAAFGDASRDETAMASVRTETMEIPLPLFDQLMQFDTGRIEQIRDITTRDLVSRANWEVRPESKGLAALPPR